MEIWPTEFSLFLPFFFLLTVRPPAVHQKQTPVSCPAVRFNRPINHTNHRSITHQSQINHTPITPITNQSHTNYNHGSITDIRAPQPHTTTTCSSCRFRFPITCRTLSLHGNTGALCTFWALRLVYHLAAGAVTSDS